MMRPVPFWRRPVQQRAQQHIKQLGRVAARHPELMGWRREVPPDYQPPEGLDPELALLLLNQGIDPSPDSYDYEDAVLDLADDWFQYLFGKYSAVAKREPVEAIQRYKQLCDEIRQMTRSELAGLRSNLYAEGSDAISGATKVSPPHPTTKNASTPASSKASPRTRSPRERFAYGLVVIAVCVFLLGFLLLAAGLFLLSEDEATTMVGVAGIFFGCLLGWIAGLIKPAGSDVF